jgi:hypothetical protein
MSCSRYVQNYFPDMSVPDVSICRSRYVSSRCVQSGFPDMSGSWYVTCPLRRFPISDFPRYVKRVVFEEASFTMIELSHWASDMIMYVIHA